MQIVRDTQLLLMVLAFVCFDVVLLIIWQSVDSITVKRVYLPAMVCGFSLIKGSQLGAFSHMPLN